MAVAPLLLKARGVSPSHRRVMLRGEPFSSRSHAAEAPNTRHHLLYMKAKKKAVAEQEPMGIVISRGSRLEHVPTFSAYIWAPDPEEKENEIEPKVA
jgi:hypothetical protein